MFFSHTKLAPATSHQSVSSNFLSQQTSTDYQPQPAEQSGGREILIRERAPAGLRASDLRPGNFPFLESFIFRNFLFLESYKFMCIKFVYNFYA